MVSSSSLDKGLIQVAMSITIHSKIITTIISHSTKAMETLVLKIEIIQMQANTKDTTIRTIPNLIITITIINPKIITQITNIRETAITQEAIKN
jgi:hypothetical protein